MIDLFDLYRDFVTKVNTSQNGFFRPQTDFERAVNDASILLWNRLIDEAERSQRGTDELRPFLKSKNIIVKSQSSFYGIVDLPKDYGRYATSRILLAGDMCVPCNDVDEGKCDNGLFKTPEELAENYYETVCEAQIEKIDQQRWSSVLTHLTKHPTLQKPKITQIDGSLKVAPRKVSLVVLDYYIKPKYATFVYTNSPGNLQTGAGDQIIYNKNQSVPLEWPETVKNELLDILKDVYIGFTRDSQFQQISAQQKQLNP